MIHHGEKTLMTNQGIPVADNQNSLTAGQRGPLFVQDVRLIEKLAHFRPGADTGTWCARNRCLSSRVQRMAPSTKTTFLPDPEKKTLVLQQTAVLGCPCSNTVTITAAEATVSQVGKEYSKHQSE